MPKYQVKPGFRHGVGKKYREGDEVIMTEAEAEGFLDKLEFVGKANIPIVPPTEVEKKLTKSLGVKLVDRLVRNGFKTILDLKIATPGQLGTIPGVGDSAVKKILEAIK